MKPPKTRCPRIVVIRHPWATQAWAIAEAPTVRPRNCVRRDTTCRSMNASSRSTSASSGQVATVGHSLAQPDCLLDGSGRSQGPSRQRKRSATWGRYLSLSWASEFRLSLVAVVNPEPEVRHVRSRARISAESSPRAALLRRRVFIRGWSRQSVLASVIPRARQVATHKAGSSEEKQRVLPASVREPRHPSRLSCRRRHEDREAGG